MKKLILRPDNGGMGKCSVHNAAIDDSGYCHKCKKGIAKWVKKQKEKFKKEKNKKLENPKKMGYNFGMKNKARQNGSSDENLKIQN